MSQLNISANNLSHTQPLRGSSPESRYSVAAPLVAPSSLGMTGGAAAANAANLIFTYQNEVSELRKRVSACRSIEDQIANYQTLLNSEANNKRISEEEGRSRLEAS